MHDLQLQLSKPVAQLGIFNFRALGALREVGIVAPPVEPYLLSFVYGADEQAYLQREQLYVRERHLDVACDDQPLIEDSVEHVYQARRA